MTNTVKRSVIGYCVALGNMFLAHGAILGFGADLDFYMLCALQLAANIVLYFAVLKKQFEPVKERKPLFYFLLAAAAGAVWTGAYFIFNALLEFDIIELELDLANEDAYTGLLLGFLPLLLMFAIVFSAVYYTLFRKRVGELYYFYTLGISLAGAIPAAVLILMYPYD